MCPCKRSSRRIGCPYMVFWSCWGCHAIFPRFCNLISYTWAYDARQKRELSNPRNESIPPNFNRTDFSKSSPVLHYFTVGLLQWNILRTDPRLSISHLIVDNCLGCVIKGPFPPASNEGLLHVFHPGSPPSPQCLHQKSGTSNLSSEGSHSEENLGGACQGFKPEKEAFQCSTARMRGWKRYRM